MNETGGIPTFDDILARCLEDVVRRHRTVEECLNTYPEQAAELKPLLLAGLMTARLNTPQMADAQVAALETRLKTLAATVPPFYQEKSGTRSTRYSASAGFAWGRLAAIIAIVMLLALGSGAGLVAASSNSLPGDPLYGLKRWWEAIILALSPLTGQPDDLWLQIGRTRLHEVEQLASEGRLTEAALVDLHRAIYHLSGLTTRGNLARLLDYITTVDTTLSRITPPAEARAVYEDVLAVTQQNVERGTVQQPPSELPASQIIVTATATVPPPPTLTATITPTPTATLTFTSSVTPSITPSATPTATATTTPSRTPRIPATATKTVTPTPSSTFTITPSITPTATWTDLPLPVGIFGSPATATPDAPGAATNTPDAPGQAATERVRATQQSVYMTQTAGPPSTTPQGP